MEGRDGRSGGGRWRWHDKAQTVDDGLTLDLGKLLRDGLLTPNRWGTLTWTSTRTGYRLGRLPRRARRRRRPDAHARLPRDPRDGV